MNSKQIASKSAIYLIGNLSSKFMSALLIPIYAYFVASADLGAFDYSQSIMNVLVPILFVAFWEGVLKFVLISTEQDKSEIINTTTIFIVAISAIYSIIAFAGYPLTKDKYTWIFTWGMTISHGIAWVWQYLCRAVKETKQYLFASVVGAAVNLLATVIFVCILRWSLFGLYAAYILGQMAVFFIIEFKLNLIRHIRMAMFNGSLLKRMLVFSVPLMFNTLGLWIIPLLLRTVVINNIGSSANGLYAFANKFNIVVTLLGTVVSMALVEEAILSSKEGSLSEDYGKAVSKIFVIFEQLTAVAILAIAVAYELLTTTEYYVTVRYFSWFLIYSLLMNLGSYIGTVFQVINITKYQFISTMCGGLVGVSVAYFLSLHYGMWGIITGQIVAGILIMLIRYLVARAKSSFHLFWKDVIHSGILVLLATGVSMWNGDILVRIAAFGVCCIIVCHLNREQFGKGIHFLLSKTRRAKKQ